MRAADQSELRQVLGRLNGLATRAELIDAGFSSARIRRQLRAGAIAQLSRGVYVRPDLAVAAEADPARVQALLAAAGIRRVGATAVASHQSAAIMHGLALMSQSARTGVALTRPVRDSRSQSRRVGLHLHIAQLPPGHLTSVHSVRVTTVARTVVDLARTLPFADGVVVADSALHFKKTTRAELMAVCLACARWPGNRKARQVIDFSDHRSESVLESIARVAFGQYGLPAPVLQAWVGGDDGVVGRADFFWPEHGTVAEADGAMKYADPGRAISRLDRDERLREAGFEVVHFTWHQIVTVPWQVVAAIRAAFGRGDAARGVAG